MWVRQGTGSHRVLMECLIKLETLVPWRGFPGLQVVTFLVICASECVEYTGGESQSCSHSWAGTVRTWGLGGAKVHKQVPYGGGPCRDIGLCMMGCDFLCPLCKACTTTVKLMRRLTMFSIDKPPDGSDMVVADTSKRLHAIVPVTYWLACCESHSVVSNSLWPYGLCSP